MIAANLADILSRLRALQPGTHGDERDGSLCVDAGEVDRIADDLEHAIREMRREPNARNERTERTAPGRERALDQGVEVDALTWLEQELARSATCRPAPDAKERP